MKRIVYDYVDESSIDEDLKCSICKEPFQQAMNTPCDHTFCQSCIEEWMNDSYNSCPACRRPLSKSSLMPATRIVVKLLDRLHVKCPTCGQNSIQRITYIDHITKSCPLSIVVCSASDILCPWKGPRHSLQKHLDLCSYEQIRFVLTDLIKLKQRLNEKNLLFLTEQRRHKSEINKFQENEQNFRDQIEQRDEKLIEQNNRILQLQNNESMYKERNEILTRQLKEAHLHVGSITEAITFDVLDTSSQFSCDRIPNHFAGYNWVNGWYITKHHATTQHPNISWLTAFSDTDNHTCVAYNKDGNALILRKSLQGHQFSIDSFGVIPIHHVTMELIITARRAQQQIYSGRVQLSELVTHHVELHWHNIDELEFRPIGLTAIPRYKHSVGHFALVSLQLTDTEYS